VDAVRFRVLGPLEATRAGAPVALGGSRPRAVLAALLLAGGHQVRMDALVDAVWGDSPPDTAVKTVQKYVSQLRAQLGTPGLIVSGADGYRLETADVDSRAFEALVAEGMREQGPERAADALTRALELWRGDPYPDLPDLASAQTERRRLVEQRLAAIEALAEARLALGQHSAMIAWLHELVAAYPLRERLWGLLMRALYRDGRQAEALAAFARLRATLIDELGADPTPALQVLHERILRHEEETPPRPARGPRLAAPPLHLTRLVGRDREITYLTSALGSHRLVTLTGPAGSGKTRLAAELFDRFTSGQGMREQGTGEPGGDACFVELAGVTDPNRVPSAVTNALRLGEQPGRELAQLLADSLATRRLLLVLDNCEHVLDAAADLVTGLLSAARGLRVLATGRQPLGAGGEVIVEVPPLDLPETDEPATVAASDAVTLLMMRAEAAGAGFLIDESNAADVARIARRLDGLPLALELAAVRLRVFGTRRLADLLDDRFAVLVSSIRTAPPRHQTLRAAVTWSYDLLDDDEKGLFRALSVFEGGFDLPAAQRVAGEDLVIALLPALVERSMVVVDRRDGNPRYRLLETLREYGRAHLDPDEAHESRRSHLAYFVELAEQAGPAVRGPLRLESLARLDADRNNLRTALNWALAHGDRTAAVRLAAALNAYWDEVGQFTEGASWLRDALAGATEQRLGRATEQRLGRATEQRLGRADEVAAELRALAHEGIALMAIGRGEHEHAEHSARLARELAESAGDACGVARATAQLGVVALYRGNYAEAEPHLVAALSEFARLGMRYEQGEVLGRIGHLHRLSGDYVASRVFLEQAVVLRAELGDGVGAAWSRWQLGVLARYEGDYAGAEALYEQSLAEFEAEEDASGVAHVRYSMADVARLRGDHDVATDLYLASLAKLRDKGDRRCVASILYNLGALELGRADRVGARALLRQSLALRRELGDQSGVAECLEGFAALDEPGGDPISAVRLLAVADALRTRTGSARPSSDDQAIADRLRALRTSVGDEAFDAAWRAGQDLDPDVVAAAMQDSGPDGPAPGPFPPRRHQTGTAVGDNGGHGP
jgi:predicted ATPase/DNA-binding SARP family transcriptional activator